MSKNLIAGLLFLMLFTTACSWQEYFIIVNSSSEVITIEYSVKLKSNGFNVFGNDPEIFKYDNNKIVWDKPVEQEISVIADSIIRFTLDPGNASIIGRLSNDHYTGYDQYLINGRVLNLVYLNICTTKDSVKIYPENFDRFFKKLNGYITCKIEK